MQSAKQAAFNVAATANAGMEKTKAVVQEKVEKMSAHDPAQKEMATEKKNDRLAQAELDKQEAKAHNAAAKQAASAGRPAQYTAIGTGAYATPGNGGTHLTHQTYTHSTTGALGQQPGAHQISALPGHGTGHPHGGYVEEGVATTHPSGMPADTTGHNTLAGGTVGQQPGAHQMSTLPGHGTGHPQGGYVEEGVATTHPSGMPADTTGHNTLAGGTLGQQPGALGQQPGAHQMSTLPGHGTGHPHGGYVEEGVATTHPSGMPADTTGHNTLAGGTGYGTGTGGTYEGHR